MYNTKFVQKLAFAYQLSLETTKQFQTYINSFLLSGIENFPKCAVYDIVNGLVVIFAQKTGLQSVKQDWDTDRPATAFVRLMSVKFHCADPTRQDPTRQSPQTSSETRVSDNVWSGPCSGI